MNATYIISQAKRPKSLTLDACATIENTADLLYHSYLMLHLGFKGMATPPCYIYSIVPTVEDSKLSLLSIQVVLTLKSKSAYFVTLVRLTPSLPEDVRVHALFPHCHLCINLYCSHHTLLSLLLVRVLAAVTVISSQGTLACMCLDWGKF